MVKKTWILVNTSGSLGGGVWEACRECGTLTAADNSNTGLEAGAAVLCRTCIRRDLACPCCVVVVSPEGDTDGDRR